MKKGGLFVTFENIRPLTDRGTEIGKESWKRFEVAAGKSEEEALQHVQRFGIEFFPITIEEHVKLLGRVASKRSKCSGTPLYRQAFMASNEKGVNITPITAE
jgi:hypothetical protein